MDKLVTREGTITSYRCQLASGTLILLRFLSPVIAADVLLALPALYTFPHVQSVRVVAWTLSAFKSMSPRQTHLLINLQFVLLSLGIFIISIHHRRVLTVEKVHAMERYIRDYIRLYKRPCSPRSSLLPYTDYGLEPQDLLPSVILSFFVIFISTLPYPCYLAFLSFRVVP